MAEIKEIEKVIEVLDEFYQCTKGSLRDSNVNNIIPILKEALQQMAEREKGCEYCNSPTNKFDPIFVSDKEDGCKYCDKKECDDEEDSCFGVAYKVVELNCCPKCGRDLGQHESEES